MSPTSPDGIRLQKDLGEQLVTQNVGEEIFALAARIFPICRSITGEGVRRTLREIKSRIALEMREVPTGTQVFDWTIPREWNIRDAYIRDGEGAKVVDFARSNLHVMSYSIPLRKRLSLVELKKHVHTLPEQPDAIPYRTSYYAEDWAFCMTYRQLEALRDETYEAVIDFEPRRRILDLRRVFARRRDRRRISAFGACLPPVARERQLLGGCAPDASRAANGRAEDEVQLQISVRARDDRGNRLVGAQRRGQQPHQARAGRLHGGRRGRSNL